MPPPASHEPERGAELSVATWNLRRIGRAEAKLEYLDHTRWDIACLQEVGEAASDLLAERGSWSVVDGLGLARDEGRSTGKYPHAAAIVARDGWRLEQGCVMPDTPKPAWGVQALARRGDDAISVISWQSPSVELGPKMVGYSAMIKAVEGASRPLVVGMDANRWTLRTTLELSEYNPDSRFQPEQWFFSREADHGLRDALLVYLREHPKAYAEVLSARPDGPLEITYKRRRTPDRFDYVMASEDFAVLSMTHDYEGGRAAGSDHGFVSAQLALVST